MKAIIVDMDPIANVRIVILIRILKDLTTFYQILYYKYFKSLLNISFSMLRLIELHIILNKKCSKTFLKSINL